MRLPQVCLPREGFAGNSGAWENALCGEVRLVDDLGQDKDVLLG